jgi:hypothetical protein
MKSEQNYQTQNAQEPGWAFFSFSRTSAAKK